MIWELLFISTLFGPEVIHHRIPLPDLAICQTLAREIPRLLIELNEPVELEPGLWVYPRMPAYPQAVCRAAP